MTHNRKLLLSPFYRVMLSNAVRIGYSNHSNHLCRITVSFGTENRAAKCYRTTHLYGTSLVLSHVHSRILLCCKPVLLPFSPSKLLLHFNVSQYHFYGAGIVPIMTSRFPELASSWPLGESGTHSYRLSTLRDLQDHTHDLFKSAGL